MNVKTGHWVKLQAYGGDELVRRVVAETDQAVVVCTDEEYERAQKERREPQAIGFPKRYVIESDPKIE